MWFDCQTIPVTPVSSTNEVPVTLMHSLTVFYMTIWTQLRVIWLVITFLPRLDLSQGENEKHDSWFSLVLGQKGTEERNNRRFFPPKHKAVRLNLVPHFLLWVGEKAWLILFMVHLAQKDRVRTAAAIEHDRSSAMCHKKWNRLLLQKTFFMYFCLWGTCMSWLPPEPLRKSTCQINKEMPLRLWNDFLLKASSDNEHKKQVGKQFLFSLLTNSLTQPLTPHPYAVM